MKPHLNLRNARALSEKPLSGVSSISGRNDATESRSRSGKRVLALAIAGLVVASYQAAAQAPAPIPNWTTEAPGTSSGQYSPNQYLEQPQSQQPPAYQQAPGYAPQGGAPQYQQPPAYGQGSGQLQYPQPQYQQPVNGQDYGQQAYSAPDQGFTPPYQPNRAMSPDQLEQLVAPIALYPDNLLSMILAASTYPAEVSAADQWLHMQGQAPPEQIAAAASAQGSWDPSVKALTAFPQVLDELAGNLSWTTTLGNAYYNQPQDVMQTVQVMRSRAQSAGNLETTPQEVVTQDQGNIEIAPPTPQEVYVPNYDPWAVYGQPVDPYPGFNVLGAIGSFLGGALVHWGPGIAMQAFSATPFGWLGWGLDWLAHAIFFNHDVWCTHSFEVHDWGFAHGGARWWGAHGEMASFREHGSWGGRSGWDNRGGWSSRSGNGHIIPRPLSGGREAYGNRGGENYGREFQNGGNSYARGNYGQSARGNGFAYGSNGLNGPRTASGYGNNGVYGRSGSYGAQAYNHAPQAIGHPEPYNGAARSFAGRSEGYGAPSYGGGQQFARSTPSYGGYGRQSLGAGDSYGRAPMRNYGPQQSYGGYSEAYRAPRYSGETRSNSYGAYGGSSGYARGSSNRGFHLFGGGHSNSYGGGSYKAPKSSGYGGHSWGGGGSYKAPKAPHFSGGGHFGGHSGGGHSSGGHGGHHH